MSKNTTNALLKVMVVMSAGSASLMAHAVDLDVTMTVMEANDKRLESVTNRLQLPERVSPSAPAHAAAQGLDKAKNSTPTQLGGRPQGAQDRRQEAKARSRGAETKREQNTERHETHRKVAAESRRDQVHQRVERHKHKTEERPQVVKEAPLITESLPEQRESALRDPEPVTPTP